MVAFLIFFIIYAKHTVYIRISLATHFFLADAIGLGQTALHQSHKSRFVALSAHRYRCHIGCVCLQDDTAERHNGWQYLWQMRFLESQYTADTQYKTVELQEFAGFDLVASKAMEHAARQLILVLLQNGDHFILGLAAMDHQWQSQFHRPAHLFLKSLQLLLLELTAPVEIKSHLADGDNVRGEKCLDSIDK